MQSVQLPGMSGGIAMDRRRSLAYISGVHDSTYADQKMPDGTPGKDGDVIHVYAYGRQRPRAASSR